VSKRTTSAVWVKGVAEMLAAEGLDVRALFAAAGIDPAALEAPGARVQTGKGQGRRDPSWPGIVSRTLRPHPTN
jgi:hypothetical protein